MKKLKISLQTDESSKRKEIRELYNIYETVGGKINEIVDVVDIKLHCDNYDLFYSIFDVETLNRMLDTQIKHENYEHAEMIKKHIALKEKK